MAANRFRPVLGTAAALAVAILLSGCEKKSEPSARPAAEQHSHGGGGGLHTHGDGTYHTHGEIEVLGQLQEGERIVKLGKISEESGVTFLVSLFWTPPPEGVRVSVAPANGSNPQVMEAEVLREDRFQAHFPGLSPVLPAEARVIVEIQPQDGEPQEFWFRFTPKPKE